MASGALMAAVAARLAANWTRCAIVEDDTTGLGLSDGSPYVTIEYPVAREDQITIGAVGNNVFRETGAFRLVLVSEMGQGRTQPIAWIDELRALFRSKNFDHVTTFAPSPGVVDTSNYRAGKFVVSSAVPYYIDLFA
ncbi:phage tail terminator-like protein [Bradyrhizobium sp. HKCCYLR1051]|uniref:phage tail terminator-like protein n=1 Tax=Bradyrhizobium sp. HKCCYLR1051 TaxID=3420738 RepID=UPI003EBA7840